MTHPTVIKLHDGNLMPQLGLGVWKAGNEEVVSAIHKALEVGYRSLTPPPRTKMKPASAMRCSAGVPAMSCSSPRNCGTTIKNSPKKRCRKASKLKLDYVDLIPNSLAGSGIYHYVDAWKA
jgi:2,5-diketo-D-gluconate reductase A